jgi:hypothetical protein
MLGSAGAVVGMIALAWLLGFRESARIKDKDHLARLLASEDPQARFAHVFIDARGRGALARLTDGRNFAAKPMGARIAARIFPGSSVRVRVEQTRVKVRFADAGFPSLRLETAGEAPDWLVALDDRKRRSDAGRPAV